MFEGSGIHLTDFKFFQPVKTGCAAWVKSQPAPQAPCEEGDVNHILPFPDLVGKRVLRVRKFLFGVLVR